MSAFQFFHYYLDTLFLARNLKELKAILHDDLVGFGTGAGEVSFDIKTSLRLYQQDLSNAPNPIQYQIKKSKIQCLVEEKAYLFLGVLSLKTEILNQSLTFNHLRLSITATCIHNKWSVRHVHASFPTSEHCADEAYPIKELEERNSWLERSIAAKTCELEYALADIKKLAETDKLTGLFNRHNTDKLINSYINQAQLTNQPFSILMIDADHFKRVNDKYGHIAGDKLLVQLSQRVQQQLRKNDTIGRWGGEEFLIICPDIGGAQANKMAERICTQIATSVFEVNAQQTVSIGVTQYQPGDTLDSLISRADNALYLAKKQGRNQAVRADHIAD
ncbi:diguanylate cyclase [Thiomicrospira microaerophila]|uniref:diguanylate cyclase n=1 Tax=Thiomicrospira microaerophila TaxID=406020 RepID=UPI0005C8CA2C|nr:diguanylate cyclase [Thiomicrospira microaerophila]